MREQRLFVNPCLYSRSIHGVAVGAPRS
jgi:hypothetical protein